MRSSVLLLFCCAVAAQGEWVELRCRRAEELARAEEYVAAAKIYGEALAKAHDKGRALAEQQIAISMRTAFERLWQWEAGPDGAGQGGLRAVLHAVMKELDPERSAAFVSAHLLAEQLLLRATWQGDGRFVREAAAVLEEHADDGDDVGKCALAMRDYARGMVALADGDDDAAAKHLEQALAAMLREGWTNLALHAGVELTALRLRRKDRAAAKAALDRTASAYSASDGDAAFLWMWRQLMKSRLGDAPDPVLESYLAALRAHEKRGPVQPPEGRGRAGASGGREATSLLGRSLARFSKRKPLATVARKGDGFELRMRFDKRFEGTQKLLHGVRYHSHEGLHFCFWDRAVGVHRMDETGLEAEPDVSEWPSPWEPLYHLAQGETLGVTKRGEVSIE